MEMRIALLALSALAVSALPVQHSQTFSGPDMVAQTLSHNIRSSGQCGRVCNTPRQMYTATYRRSNTDYLLVSWTGTTAMTPSTEYPDLWDDVTRGHVSTFTVTANGRFTQVSDIPFNYCFEMGGVTATADGSTIGVLCKSKKGTQVNQQSQIFDLHKDHADSFGWTNERVKRDNVMHLLEFSNSVRRTPRRIAIINKAIGGWNYGDWELSLNNAGNRYHVDMKATVGGHEGVLSYRINRNGMTLAGSSRWGCGPGHVLVNLVTHHPITDRWSRYCLLDWCVAGQEEKRGCYSSSWSTVSGVTNEKTVELAELSRDGRSIWDGYGGPSNMIPRGRGYLALGIGPGGTTPNKLQLRELPASSDGRIQRAWRTLANIRAGSSSTVDTSMGMLGRYGRDGSKILLGWAPNTQKGEATEYAVVEISSDLTRRSDPIILRNAGWAERNVWNLMPGSGCAVFPFAMQNGRPGTYGVGFGQRSRNHRAGLSNELQLTSICDDGNNNRLRRPLSYEASAMGESSAASSSAALAAILPAVFAFLALIQQ